MYVRLLICLSFILYIAPVLLDKYLLDVSCTENKPTFLKTTVFRSSSREELESSLRRP